MMSSCATSLTADSHVAVGSEKAGATRFTPSSSIMQARTSEPLQPRAQVSQDGLIRCTSAPLLHVSRRPLRHYRCTAWHTASVAVRLMACNRESMVLSLEPLDTGRM